MPIIFPIRSMPGMAVRSARQLASPWLIRGAIPLPSVYLRIFGITKDSAGVALGNCDVHLFRTSDDVEMDQSTSDASGNYEFRSASLSTTYYVVAYKAGAPDVSGTTLNTLVGTS